MALSEIDRHLLERCLAGRPGAWEDFVDRFVGLVVHVINHSAQSRSVRLTPQDREDLAADIFLALLKDDFAVLRHFRGQSSLATYLTVVARRVVVRGLLKRNTAARLAEVPAQLAAPAEGADLFENREEVARLLDALEDDEAEVARLFYLEGKSYREISAQVGVPENSVGPLLSRAREKMRTASPG